MDTDSNPHQKHNTATDEMFVTCFQDKNGTPIKEGDTIKETIIKYREEYHYEERYNSMGDSGPARIIHGSTKIEGWCLRKIKWDGNCLIAERIKDSGNITTSAFHYLNESFADIIVRNQVEIVST